MKVWTRMLVLVVAVHLTASARAATITVNSTADTAANDGACTLREAIIAANTNAASGAAAGECAAGSGADTIAFSVAGTISVASVLPPVTQQLLLNGYSAPGAAENTNAGGADNAAITVVLNGAALGSGVGIDLMAGSSNSTVQGLRIINFLTAAIRISDSSGNVVRGNFIGFTAALAPAPNGRGVLIASFSAVTPTNNNRVGGVNPGDRNVISANSGSGVDVSGGPPNLSPSGTLIQGNYLGPQPNGTATFASSGRGISMGGAVNTTIGGTTNTVPGGTCQGACNLISGGAAGFGGIVITGQASRPAITTNVTVQGNYIGTNAAGTAALGNGPGSGIFLGQIVDDITIGGTTAAARNLISGQAANAIDVQNLDAIPVPGDPLTITIRGNYIGTTVTGNSPLGNGGYGILMASSSDVTIGGTAAGSGNVLSGNTLSGVRMDGGANNIIQGNHIGVGADGSTSIPNLEDGIQIRSGGPGAVLPNDNLIGAATTGGTGGNIIASNGRDGVRITFGDRNRISTNSIVGNVGLGIDLGGDGVTPNDNCDPDAGPNTLQNFPVLTSAVSNGASTTISGTLNSTASQTFTIEFYRSASGDEGDDFAGSTTVSTNATCTTAFSVSVPFAMAAGDRVTALAIDASGNTSEFSAAVIAALTPLSVTKAFVPSSIAANGTSVLTVTITNPNATPATSVAFTDIYPAGVTNTAAPSGASSGCGGGVVAAAANGTQVMLTNGTITNGTPCVVTVNVTSAATGDHLNQIGAGGVSSANVPSNTTPASATLSVTGSPSVTKGFSPSAIAGGGTSTLTITLSNPNSVAITGVAFTDTYPANVVNAAAPNVSNTCGGSVTANAGAGSIALSGGAIPVAGCQITVSVTSNVAGSHVNTIPVGGVASANAGSNTVAANGTLTVLSPLTVTKTFAPDPIAPGGASTLTITLSNTNATPLTNIAFTDTYPAPIDNAAVPGAATNCSGGIVAAAAGGGSVALSSASLAASSSCTVTVAVTSSTAGTHVNSIPVGAVTSTQGVSNAVAATDDLTVNSPPAVAKAFNPATIATGGTSTLTLTLTNPNATALTGVAVTDTYPAGVTNAPVPNGATSCGGTLTAIAGGGTVALSGGTIPASGSCTVSVVVTSSTAGPHVNTIPAGGVATANGGASTTPATATLTVSALTAPSVSKAFSPAAVPVGVITRVTITLTNPNTTPISGVAFNDAYPAQVVNASVPAAATTCGGSVTAAAGGSSLSLIGGTIPASGSCTVSADVVLTAGASGTITNTIAAGDVTSSNAPPNGAPASGSVVVVSSSAIPALSLPMLLLLAMLLAGVGWVVSRR